MAVHVVETGGTMESDTLVDVDRPVPGSVKDTESESAPE
jgi:hypothetical protein